MAVNTLLNPLLARAPWYTNYTEAMNILTKNSDGQEEVILFELSGKNKERVGVLTYNKERKILVVDGDINGMILNFVEFFMTSFEKNLKYMVASGCTGVEFSVFRFNNDTNKDDIYADFIFNKIDRKIKIAYTCDHKSQEFFIKLQDALNAYIKYFYINKSM